jgi:hypothetical protein
VYRTLPFVPANRRRTDASLVAFLGHPAPMEVAVDNGVPVHVLGLHITRKECSA